MAKIPDCERPDWKLMQAQLYKKVSPQYRQIFVEDLQNDCACEVETYSVGIDNGALYLSAPDTVEVNLGCEMPLPMVSDISDASVLLLLKKVCEKAEGYTTNDVIPYVSLLSNKATLAQQDRVRKQISRSWKTESIILVDFVSEDSYFLFPEPEFFGVLTMNIRGYGSFGIPNNVSRCYYDS
jgi:hypothetical protein